MTRTVSEFMTKQAHTIEVHQPLAQAHKVMREHGFRHLPVLEGGKLVGVVSQGDLHLIETLKGVTVDEVSVEEAMSQGVYTVPPSAPLGEVAAQMAEHRYGSAVVVEKARVVGIFTTSDALRALSQLAG